MKRKRKRKNNRVEKGGKAKYQIRMRAYESNTTMMMITICAHAPHLTFPLLKFQAFLLQSRDACLNTWILISQEQKVSLITRKWAM